MATINVVVGPPCAGKSTLVSASREPDDVVVDFDLIASALGSAQGHGADGSIREMAFRARRSVVRGVIGGIPHDSWVIHTNPSKSQVQKYYTAGAVFHLVDPGKDVCLSRAEKDNRPDGTVEAIESWYESPPSLEVDEDTESEPLALIWSNSMQLNLKARGLRSELSPRALEKWNPSIQAAVDSSDATITIYGVIGEDWYGEGVTLNRVDAALRSIGDRPVTVYINSPGGDMFEGIAIYNRLREHSQKVTTKVLGIAASAASVIYLAGEDREVASSAFLMIHNCWCCMCGNRHALRDVADDMEEFDAAMADLYAETSGQSSEDVAGMMDDESYIRGKRAVELGLATGLLSAGEVVERETEATQQANAMKAMDVALAKAGMTRSERRELFANFKSSTPRAAGGGTPRAASTDTPSAVAPDLAASLDAVQKILSQIGGNNA